MYVFLGSEVQAPATDPRVKKPAGTGKMRWMILVISKGMSPVHSLRFLLLLAGVERNPGPTRCESCRKPVQASHVACSHNTCAKVSHLQFKCSGLKGSDPRVTWLCSEHRHDPTHPPPTAPLCTLPPLKCNRCNKPVKDSHFKCAEAPCSNVCHKQASCSCLSREKQLTGRWICREHNPECSGESEPTTNTTRLEPSNKKCPMCESNLKQNPVVCTQCQCGYHQKCSKLNRYSVAKTKDAWKCPRCENPACSDDSNGTAAPPEPTARTKLPCLKCKKPVRPNHVTCITCKKVCHQGKRCSGLSTRGAREAAVKGNFWQCHICVKKSNQPDEPPKSQDDIHEKSEPKTTMESKPIRILQWNAEGINTKMEELRVFLQDYKIDIAMIQESKLTSPKASPAIKGFALVRGDRKNAEHPGGGLLTYIREDLAFKANGHSQRGVVELLSVSIQQAKKKWLTLNNIYIPRGDIDLSWIPIKGNTITAGDFNGHCGLWDDEQPSDSRGDYIVDWMLENDLSCMNDGSPTRINRGTAGLSTPDISFVNQEISQRSRGM